MASSKPEIKKPGGGGSLLAPSKFGANFGRADNKRLFTGLKASKLTSVTQSVCGSSTVSALQPQNTATETASGTIASSNPFSDPSKTLPSSSCTPLVSKVTLNTGTKSPESSNKESTEKSNDTSKLDVKISESNKTEESTFVFGQNLANRAENFPETSEDKLSNAETDVGKKAPSEPSTGFVFGQNIAERVSNTEIDTDKDKNTTSGENEKPPDALPKDLKSLSDEAHGDNSSQDSKHSDPNPNENEQSSPTKDESSKIEMKKDDPSASLTCKTLNENAKEYFESHIAPPKRKYDEVEVITGEENEHNVLHLSGKLYIFHKPKGWLEKGRGELRLNDLSVAAANASISRDAKRKVLSSRIVMRTVGSLRVILNTQVYHGMSVEKPNEKSIRLTGMEDGEVKVFLISASPKDTDALHCALKSRLAELKSIQEENDELEREEQKIALADDIQDIDSKKPKPDSNWTDSKNNKEKNKFWNEIPF